MLRRTLNIVAWNPDIIPLYINTGDTHKEVIRRQMKPTGKEYIIINYDDYKFRASW